MPSIELELSALPLNTPTRLEVAGTAIVVVRTTTTIHAYLDMCPHAFWPLSEGLVSNGILECPGHGWEFSVESGKCLNAPAYCLTPIAITTEGEIVRLQLHPAENLSEKSCQI